MDKRLRKKVFDKYGGRCAYCGKKLVGKGFQVDHIAPLFRNHSNLTLELQGIVRGKNNFENMNPSCARCNWWKSSYSVEAFRYRIEEQMSILKRNSNGFRLAFDFGRFKETTSSVVFYFE